MKACRSCGVAKEYGAFVTEPRMADGTRNTCKACKNAKRRDSGRERARVLRATDPTVVTRERAACRKWHHANKDRARVLARKTNLRRYGLVETDYTDMLHRQKGVCAICLGNRSARKCRLAVDHCHSTNRVRGLLCTNCNAGIGYFADSPALLMAAIHYLEMQARAVA